MSKQRDEEDRFFRNAVGNTGRPPLPDPTPALPPMDGMEPRAHFNLMAHYMAVADSPEGYEAIRDDLWRWVVAYGDRRAEEARKACLAVVEAAMLPPMHPSDHEYLALEMVASELAALSSPAPEGGS